MESQSEDRPFFRLRLFIAGEEPNSSKAVFVVTRLCEERLKERYELQIVDVFKDYQSAIEHRVVAVPCLIVESPEPRRVIVGSLADEKKLLTTLGLTVKGDQL